MDTLTHLFSRLTTSVQTGFNFLRLTKTTYGKLPPPSKPFALKHHHAAVRYALVKHLYPNEVQAITNSFKRDDVTPELIENDFFNGDIPEHPILRDHHYYNALNDVEELFRPERTMRPVHFYDVYHMYPFKRSTNAEPPFTTDPKFMDIRNSATPARNTLAPRHPERLSTGDLLDYDEFKDYFVNWIHNIKDGTEPDHRYFYHMSLHIKTAITKFDDPAKIRSIFGVPKLWIFTHVMFFWTLFNYYKTHRGSSPLLWGYETLNGGWMLLNHELFRSHMRASFLMIDWKRFDKYANFSVCKELLSRARNFLSFDNGYVPTHRYPDTSSTWTPQKAQRLQNLFQWSIDALLDTPVVLPDGWMYQRLHSGIPSGLYITQFLDSLYNALMIITILRSLSIPISSDLFIKVMGDDSLTRFFLVIPPNMHQAFWTAFQHAASLYFGAIVSLSKSKLTTSLNQCEVLGYANHNGLPHRDPISLLAQLYHTKARKPTPETTMSQAIGIAYASAGHDRRVFAICKDLFDHYQSQGYTANRKGLSLVFPDLGLFDIYDIPLDRFPSRHECYSNTLSFGFTNPKLQERFWPSSHFLDWA